MSRPTKLPCFCRSLAPSDRQRRAAYGICAAFLIAFAVTVPFAYTPLPRLDAWIPASTTALIITDLVTATLLFSQFAIARQRALLVLATGYLFSALIVVPYALTFPGLFAPTGLLGADLQSAVWLYIVWHIASPSSVVVYTLLKEKDVPSSPPSDRSVRADISLAIAASIVIVVAVTGFDHVRHDPCGDLSRPHQSEPNREFRRHRRVPGMRSSDWAALVSQLIGAGFVAHRYPRCRALEITLQGLFLTDRFSLARYVGRIYSLVAASVVLIVLLSEATALYAHLARTTMRQRAARNARQVAMDTMAASIAHEVNQPLGSIALNAEAALLYLTRTLPNTWKKCAPRCRISRRPAPAAAR